MDDSSPYIFFPDNLLALNASDVGHPQVEFTVQQDAAHGGSFKSIYLPMPRGVQFSDGADFSTIDLGNIAGAGGIDALADMMGGEFAQSGRAALGVASQQINSIKTRLKATLTEQLPGIDEEKAMFAIKKIKAPNQNATFKGNTMREFTFMFSLIANSEKETKSIAAIHSLFRRYLYAGTSDDAPNVILDYPPVWKIRFMIGTKENEFMPKIFATYLSGFACTFNSQTNIFRYNGAPFSTDFSLSFKETRVLTRNDIDNLAANPNDTQRGINPKTGLATSSQPPGTRIPISNPGSVSPAYRRRMVNMNTPNE